MRNVLIAIRNFKKRITFTLINVLGLTVGMTVSMLILIYARYELSYDRFHSNADEIYRLSVIYHGDDGVSVQDAEIYPGAGLMAKEVFPEIEEYAMARHWGRLLFSRNQRSFNEDRAYFVNSGWLTLFDWDFISGNKQSALNGPDMAVISETAAEKYFGDEDPMGEFIKVVIDGEQVNLMVSGVVKDVPLNAHLKFDILISYETGITRLKWTYENWSSNNEYIYVLANTDKLLEGDFESRLNKAYLERTSSERTNRLEVQKLTDIHLKSDKTFEAEANGSDQIVNTLLIVAAFVMIIAWVNYINLATARALDRGKEVGVRKVLGSSKLALFRQFLTESFLINFFALILTFTCIQGVLPAYNKVSGLQLDFKVFDDLNLLILLLSVFLIGAIVAGTYPALVLANFKPLTVLTGRFKDSKKGMLLRKGLVVFQFTMTMILLVGTITIYKQINHMRSQELGIDIDQTIVIKAPIVLGNENKQTELRSSFKAELRKIPRVRSISYSGTIFGQGTTDMSTTTGMFAVETEQGKGNNFYSYKVDEEFIPTFGLQILAGRAFNDEFEVKFEDARNLYNGIIINERVREIFGFMSNEEAINKKVNRWGRIFTIVGVINNYNHHSLKRAIDPTVLFFDKKGVDSNYTSIKINSGNDPIRSYKDLVSDIRSAYQNVYPSSDFDYYFLDDHFNEQYKSDQQFGQVFTTFSALAIFISILGLFGLVLFEIQQRIKEIGIRKVLGAEPPAIVMLFVRNFLSLILIAILVALPVSFFGIREWLNGYAYRIEINWILFVVPLIVLLGIALTTISLQSIKAANQNPIKALRYE